MSEVWDRALKELRLRMTGAAFDAWLGNTSAERSNGTLTILTPSIYAQEWLDRRLRGTIEEAVAAVVGEPLELVFAIRPEEPEEEDPEASAEPLPPPPNEFDLLTADEILTTDWPEPIWAVPGLLPVGLTILAGKPKMGKSWLALQLAQAVAAGGHVLGEEVEAGPVLYLALEDPPRRLKERMQIQRWPGGLAADFMVMGQFAQQIGDLGGEGSLRLARQIQRRRYRLVVIDTLSRSVSGDQNDVEVMTKALSPVQEMAHSRNCAVILVDHHGKSGGVNLDAIADILGSTAKGALADTAWGLYRERGRSGAKLSITGREVIERTLALSKNHQTQCWHLEGDANSIDMTERRQEILDVLELLGEAQGATIAREVGQNIGSVYKRLQDLVHAGLVLRSEKEGSIIYALPPIEPIDQIDPIDPIDPIDM